MHPLIEQHRAQIRALAKGYGIEDIRIFGSTAGDDADLDSDNDLLVSLPPGKSGLVLGGLLLGVQELMQREVDLVTQGGLHPALREQILRGGPAIMGSAPDSDRVLPAHIYGGHSK